jgi:hypothetical protein
MKIYHTLKNCIVLIILSLSWPQLSSGQGNLVVNGGFDVDASGWILTNGATFADPIKGDPGGWVGLDSSSPSLTTDPTISQSINGLLSGETYTVSGNFKKTINRNGIITGLSFGVAVDGNFLFEAADPGNFNWQSFTFLYTATSSSALLSLSSQMNGTQVSYGIDNISMQVVPEPSAALLLLLGGGFFLYARHAGKKSSPRT